MSHQAVADVAGKARRGPVVLYTLGVLNIGGSERRSLQMFERILPMHPELRIHLYVQSQQRGTLEDQFVAAGVNVIHGHTGLKAFLDFWRVCRSVRPTIVHTAVGTTNGLFLFAAFLSGVRQRICHFRNTTDDLSGVSGAFKRFIGRALTRRLATRLVGVSDACRMMVDVRDAKWLTIYNGIEPDDCAAPLAHSAMLRVLVLGRISPQKNYLRPVAVMEALARLAPEKPFVLDYVGPGPSEHVGHLAERIAASAVREKLGLKGPSDTPVQELRGADVLLFPSFFEGLPGAVLEALSVGTPVVASDIPPNREISRFVTGLTLVPLEAPDELWAQAVSAAAGRWTREEIKASFAASPFLFDDHLAAIQRLWRLPARNGSPGS